MINTSVHLSPKQKKTAIILAVVITAYLLFGFIGAPLIVRHLLEKRVSAAIDREISVGAVRINPLSLSATLRHLSLRERNGEPFVNLDEFHANLQASSLFKWAVVLKTLRLVNPDISLVRTGPASFNFSDIGRRGAAESKPTADDGGGVAVSIHEIAVSGGRIRLDDRVVAVNHRIDDLNLNLADLSSRPADAETDVRFDLSLRINDAPLSLKGTSRPFTPARQTRVQLDLKAFQVPHYLPYLTLPENLIVATLTFESESEIAFRLLENDTPELMVAGLFSIIEARLADGKGDPFVYHPRLTLDLLPSAILSGQVKLAAVETTGPEYHLKRLPSGDLYLPFLAVRAYDRAEEKAAADTTGDFRPVVTIDALRLKEGVVHFSDLSNSEPFSTTLTDLDLEMDNVGINSDRTALVRLGIKTDTDETIRLTGTASQIPLQAAGTIDVTHVALPSYRPYYQDLFDFKIPDGRLSFGGDFRFRQEEGHPRLSLAGAWMKVGGLKVVDEDDDEPLMAIDRLEMADTTAEVDRREVTLGKIELANAHLVCRREKDGTLNLARAFLPAPATPHKTEAVTADGEATAVAAPASPAVTVNLKRIEVADVTVEVEDRVPADPFRIKLDAIAVTASNLSTLPETTGKLDLSLRWEQGGEVRTGGDLTLVPLKVDAAVKIKAMDIRPFQPYLSEQAGLIVTQGFFNTEGRLNLSAMEKASPAMTFRGKAGLERFASIDRKNANDFLKWEDLALEKLEVGVNPTRVSVEEISLADFFARVIVDSDGSVNLVSMFTSPDELPGAATASAVSSPEPNSSSPPPDAAGRPAIRIARVSLSNGDVDFSDRLIKPNFSAKFHDLGGRVSGLESIAEKRADVLLEGMWSNHAPVKITGQINPLIEDPYVDLNLNISDIELSPFSPYSGKYLGYILEKGKLTFNVAYLMENRKLEGANSIYINQLTLGDTVDSPDAVSLPIKLAVALLKDREGNIALDLPVTGSLDDPQFKIGKVILTILKNLIVKIVTSPFAALGALAGGGEELSYLDFEAGISTIDPQNAEKMDKLAKILYERPGLSLDIQGTAAATADSEALRGFLLENRLKARKLEQLLKAGKSAVPLEAITFNEGEREALLEAVFAESEIAVPKGDSGKPVELTPDLREQLLRANTQVSQNDYRNLANARAFNAKTYLLETGQVERERVFIVEPRIDGDAEQAPSEPVGQVVFSLK